MKTLQTKSTLLENFQQIRNRSTVLCRGLQPEDYVVQPVVDVSPPKWHLGHTSWFFEHFILSAHLPGYRVFHPEYEFVFNSYYESVGARVLRTDRGNLSRPSVDDVYRYRDYVDAHIGRLLNECELPQHAREAFILGLNHEQQHQELLLTDIKYILGHNPLFPPLSPCCISETTAGPLTFVSIPEGVYNIGHEYGEFCFDNELGRHKVYLNAFEIASRPVTNAEFLEFMADGGYRNFRWWHSEGWDWVKSGRIQAPLYWHFINGEWWHYTFNGLQRVDPEQLLCHVSYYEAWAFAAWKNMRLATEAEWEVASPQLNWGQRWEWTESAYLPYPGYRKAPGAIGEYNGKFMVNQMVLRGGSVATPKGHSRYTYRNFFHPLLRWQFSGIRLVK